MNFTCLEWNKTVYSELYSEIPQFFTTTDYHTLIKIIYRILIKMWICIFSILPHLLDCMTQFFIDAPTLLADPQTPIIIRIFLIMMYVLGAVVGVIFLCGLAEMAFVTIYDTFWHIEKRKDMQKSCNKDDFQNQISLKKASRNGKIKSQTLHSRHCHGRRRRRRFYNHTRHVDTSNVFFFLLLSPRV